MGTIAKGGGEREEERGEKWITELSALLLV
jgi:hypothetical protein